MVATNDEISKQRLAAAEATRGISSDSIYRAVQRVILHRDLRGKALDFGAGAGNLTRALLSMNRFAQVSAADIMPAPPDLAGKIQWIEQDLNLPIENHDEAFDVVISAEVIEHLENPRAMMRDLYRLVRPGGTVIVTTPNNESWRALLALLFRGHFVSFGDTAYPAHIVALLRKDLERILREAKFDSPDFRFNDDGGLPRLPSVTWQKISFGLLRGLRYSDTLVAVATKPP